MTMWRLLVLLWKSKPMHQIATRPKKDLNFMRGLKIDTCLAVILQLNAYLLLLLLRSPINYDQLLQVSLLGFSQTTSRYKAYWFLGKWALNYYYLILSRSDQFYDHISCHCWQLVGLLLLSIATYFCRLHDFTFLLLYFISMYTAYVPL